MSELSAGLMSLGMGRGSLRAPRRRRDVKIMFYSEGDKGDRLLVMHECNHRHQEAVELEYMKKVLSMGAVGAVRGQPWAVESPPTHKDAKPEDEGQAPYRLLTFGTLTRAIYRAHELEKDNQNVKETLDQGHARLSQTRNSFNSFGLYPRLTPVDVTRLSPKGREKRPW